MAEKHFNFTIKQIFTVFIANLNDFTMMLKRVSLDFFITGVSFSCQLPNKASEVASTGTADMQNHSSYWKPLYALVVSLNTHVMIECFISFFVFIF